MTVFAAYHHSNEKKQKNRCAIPAHLSKRCQKYHQQFNTFITTALFGCFRLCVACCFVNVFFFVAGPILLPSSSLEWRDVYLSVCLSVCLSVGPCSQSQDAITSDVRLLVCCWWSSFFFEQLYPISLSFLVFFFLMPKAQVCLASVRVVLSLLYNTCFDGCALLERRQWLFVCNTMKRRNTKHEWWKYHSSNSNAVKLACLRCCCGDVLYAYCNSRTEQRKKSH